eukprot:1545866-Pleurochrysis_carterae.AAC.7
MLLLTRHVHNREQPRRSKTNRYTDRTTSQHEVAASIAWIWSHSTGARHDKNAQLYDTAVNCQH